MTKNSDIEVLRGIAVVFVILAHVGGLFPSSSAYWKVLEYSRFGSGVDLFFAISGFVITKSIAPNIPERRSFATFLDFALPFWRRRFWRLFPSVVLWVGISVVISVALGHTGHFLGIQTHGPSAIAALLQFANFHFLTCRPAGTCGELGVYWSLSLENQFYLALPFLAFFCPRRHLVKVFFAVFAVQFFLPRTLSAATPTLWPFRTDAIALGVVLALLGNRLPAKPPAWLKSRPLRIMAITSLLFLLAILTKPEPLVSFAVGLTAVVSAALVWIASFDRNLILNQGAAKQVLMWCGARSYSIYLIHLLMILATKFIWFPAAPAQPNFDALHLTVYLLTFLGLTLLASELNYRFVESPLRELGRRSTRWPSTSMSTAVRP